ncbi:MAG TPA: hypothetical protein VHK91_01055 [Flavisolibacter sp.]|jgi:hypothetical protein|nr:hypothetical protein [Flavisolibacter sp.]
MKRVLLFLLIVSSFSVKAQSLKELLYSGKLKNDSNTVIRKTDDLKTKIDTSQKKMTAPATSKPLAAADSGTRSGTLTQGVQSGTVTDSASTTVAAAPVEAAAATLVKPVNKIWKEYTDSLVTVLKSEVLSNKKVKKDTYYMLVEYEIDADGQVGVTNVTASPENEFLQGQVKERLISSPPVLYPQVDSNNKARKVKKRYNFTITKE